MDAAKWAQGFQEVGLVKPMEQIASNTCTSGPMLERRARPQEQLNCPRCNSTNTKFCYYNNYSLTQPRYFCKTCRRYWTEGGSLRNVPVGGGSRKNKRSTSCNSTSSASTKLPDLNPPNLSQFSSQNPNKSYKGQDLNLSFPSMQESTHGISQFVQVPKSENNNNNNNNNQHNSSSSAAAASFTASSLPALELLRTGIASRGLNSFIPTPMPPDSNTLYSSGFPMQEFKPTLSFSIDGLGNRFGAQENGGRLFFPFGELKQLSSTNEVDHHNKGSQGNPTGYWSGMLGGGSW